MEKIVQYDDIKLMTESFGDPKDTCLLLIMGSASSLIWWDEVLCQMLVNKGFFVIRYDHRDTGLSTVYPVGKPGYDFETLSDDAIRILDAYQVDQAVFVGMSMGGMLAQMIALRHPHRIKALVLYASMYFGDGSEALPVFSPEVKAFFDQYGNYQPEGFRAQVDYAFQQWQVTHKSDRVYDMDQIYNLIEKDVERAIDYNAKLNHAFASISTDVLSKPINIQCPTLIIHGTLDNVIPPVHGEYLAKEIPYARYVTLCGAGHEVHSDDYEVIAHEVGLLITSNKDEATSPN